MHIQDFKLIREILTRGGRVGPGEIDQSRLDELVKLGWLELTDLENTKDYTITERGRAAASYRQLSRLA